MKTEDQDAIRAAIKAEMDEAVGKSGETLSEARTALKSAYFGEPFHADADRAELGWSTYQDRSVLEAVEWAKPGLLRVFASMDDIVRFEPARPGEEQNAEDATDYINRVVFGGNAFPMIYEIIHDTLLQRVAWGKVHFETPPDELREYAGLSGDEAVALLMTTDPQDVEIETDGEMFSLKIREERSPVVRVSALASERVLWNKDARDMESCRFVAHWEERTIADLKAEGFDTEAVEGLADENDSYPETDVQAMLTAGSGADDFADRRGAMRVVRVYEAYILMPSDKGEQRWKVIFCGDEGQVILEAKEWALPRPPLFPVSSVPLPHQVGGLCLADLVMDVQRLRSELARQLLDSLALSNQGEIMVNQGSKQDFVDLDQLLARRPGGVYRSIGNVSVTPFPADAQAAAEASAALQMTDALKETRTGIGHQMRGLSADALQDTATGAVIMEDAANQRLELIARVLAEMYFKPVAKYVLLLVSRYQDKPLQARLHGRFHTWNPAEWDPDMDVSVSVGLGTGNRSRQTQALQMVLMYQEKLMSQLQGNSPVQLPHIMRALHKMAMGMGFASPEQFYGTIEDAEKASQAMAANPDAGNSEEKKKLKLEQEKARAKIAVEQEKARNKAMLDEKKLQAEIALEEKKIAANAALKGQQIEAERILDQAKMQLEGPSQGTTQIRQVSV